MIHMQVIIPTGHSTQWVRLVVVSPFLWSRLYALGFKTADVGIGFGDFVRFTTPTPSGPRPLGFFY
jgi:hypothetical protein